MPSKTAVLSLAFVLPILTPACLETEEVIEVRPDGSVEVTVSVQGDAPDLATGYPLPTGGPWRGADAGTQAWLAGGALPHRDDDEKQAEVSVRASFASVAEMPEFFAPTGALYRTAGLERRTTLQILRKGARTVYVFERTLPLKSRQEWSPHERIESEIPKEVQEAIEEGLPVRSHEWRAAVRVVQEAYRDALDGMLQQALLAVYLEGGAELSAAGCERTRVAVQEAVVAALDEQRIQRLVDFVREAEALGEAGGEDEAPRDLPEALNLDRVSRAAARAALTSALGREGLAPEITNAVLERLEWAFSAVDDALDRGDETLRVLLRLPGRLVGGNFDEIDGEGRAQWKLEGNQPWKAGDVVLRAVSVLE